MEGRLLCRATALLLLLCGGFAVSHAQTWDVDVTMQPFPSPYLNDWELNPSIGSLIVTNSGGAPTDATIFLTISRTNGARLASGNSTPINIPPGIPTQINSDRFIDWNTISYDATIRDQIIQTGRLPEGEYEACITLRDAGGNTLAANVCARFTIVYPDPPSLVFPADGDSLDVPYPIFTWTPLQVPLAYQLRYVLRIVEVFEGQTPHQALLANVPQFETTDLLTTDLQYPISALPLEAGKKYTWQVQAVDQNGFPPSGNEGRSEIWTFVVRDAGALVTLSQPTDSSPFMLTIVHDPDTTTFFQELKAGDISFSDTLQKAARENRLFVRLRTAQPFDTITVPISLHIDADRKVFALTGEIGPASVMLAAGWGMTNDPRRKTLAIKFPASSLGPFKGLPITHAMAILSLTEFDIKSADLPAEVSGFYGDEEVELKRGLNLFARLEFTPVPFIARTAELMGIEESFIKLRGYISNDAEAVVDLIGEGVGKSKLQKNWDFAISATIPGRIPLPWRSWVHDREITLEIGRKSETSDFRRDYKSADSVRHVQTIDSTERKVRLKWSDEMKVSFAFLRNVPILADTIKFSRAVQLEGTAKDMLGTFKGDSTSEVDPTIEWTIDDLVSVPLLKGVVQFHDPKLEWNLRENTVKLSGEFDLGQFQKAGELEMVLERGVADTTKSDTARTRNRGVKIKEFKATFARGAGKFGKLIFLRELISAAFNLNTNIMALKSPPASTTPAPQAGAPDVAEGAPGADSSDVTEPDIATAEVESAEADSTEPPVLSFAPGDEGSTTFSATTTLLDSPTALMASRVSLPGGKHGVLLGLKPENFSLSRMFPGMTLPGFSSAPLSNVGLVYSEKEVESQSADLTDAQFAFYRALYNADEFVVRLRPGLNLIATIRADDLEPSSPLRPLLKKLGAGSGTILLQGNIGKRIKDLYFLASLPPLQPEGAPEWFNSAQLAVELTGQPSVGLVGTLSVNIQGEVREFFVKTKVGKEGLVLVGGMNAVGGWESPFGIPGLTLNRVVLLVGLTPTGSVQLGFEGDLVVGEKDLHTAVAVAISPVGAPTNFMFDGASEEGFGVSDLVTLQQRMASARGTNSGEISLDAVPPLYVRDAKLKFAPKDSPELNIARGMTVGGLLQLAPAASTTSKDLGSVLFDVGDEGIVAQGKINPFSLGPVSLQDATLDFALTRGDQHCLISGRADLGFMNGDLLMSLTKTNAKFHAETKIFNAFEAVMDAHGVLSLTHPAFTVSAKMKNDFNSAIAQDIRNAIKEGVASGKKGATSAANAAERKWNNAINAREAAQKRWASLPLLPRDKKVAARSAWEKAIAFALKCRAEKELAQGKQRRWTLANNMIDRLDGGSGNFVVIRSAEFEADLTKLKTGAVTKMAIDATVGDRQYDLNLTGWNFKNMKSSIKGAADNIVDRLFSSFQ